VAAIVLEVVVLAALLVKQVYAAGTDPDRSPRPLIDAEALRDILLDKLSADRPKA